jgi:dihydrofolate reductase
MGRVVLTFSMSLDGFIAGPDVRVGQPMGAGGERLHEWLLSEKAAAHGVDAEMGRELLATAGAVVLGKRTFDVGVELWGDTPYPVPSFVLTQEAREELVMKSARFTFVNDGIESALRQARAAAGEKDIIVMGADVAQQALKAGLVDEMFLQLVPVLLGAGRRLFDHLDVGPIELVRTRVAESPTVTHLRFRVVDGLSAPARTARSEGPPCAAAPGWTARGAAAPPPGGPPDPRAHRRGDGGSEAAR